MYRYAIYERDDNYNGLIRLGTWNEKGEPVELKLNHTSHLYYVDSMYDNDSEETNYTTLTGKNLVRENFPNTSLRYKWIEQHPNVKLYDSLDPVTEFLHEHFHDVNEDPDFAKYPLKSYFYDIETAIGDRFPDPEIADQQITVITVGDLRTNNLYTWANLAGPWKDSVQNKFKNLKKFKTLSLFTFNSEQDMLYHFFEWFRTHRPDILSGYNIDGFDTPYLMRRGIKLCGQDIVYNSFSPVGRARKRFIENKTGKQYTSYTFEGLSILDYQILYRDKFQCALLENYKLETVCQEELGIGKLQYEGTMKQFYTRDFETFVEYNIIDVQRLIDLEKKKKLLTLVRVMCNNALCQYDRIFNVSPIVQGCLMLLARKEGKLLMTDDRIDPDSKSRPFEGAYVTCQELTKTEAFTTFDLNSLYPNIIISVNISPETKVGKIVTRIGDEIVVEINGQQKMTTIQKLKEKLGHKINIAANGVLFWKQHLHEGICSKYEKKYYYGRKQTKKEMLKLASEAADLLIKIKKTDKKFDEHSPVFAEPMKAEKERWFEIKERAEFLDCSQLGQKLNLNSLYGLFSNKHSIICDVDCAEAVTLSGQTIIKSSMAWINKYLNNENGTHKHDYVHMGDTDSVISTSTVNVENEIKTIEQFFNECQDIKIDPSTGKEYAFTNKTVLGYDRANSCFRQYPVKFLYRHKVNKKLYKITTQSGKTVTVTEDHSIMVERNGELIEVKPNEIVKNSDIAITNVSTILAKEAITNVECIGNANDEYVYDICIDDENHPYFIANDILVHNSFGVDIGGIAHKITGKEHSIDWTDEDADKLCNHLDTVIMPQINENCGKIVKNEFWSDVSTIEFKREKLCSHAMFLAPKHYAMRVVNNEGVHCKKWIHRGHCLKKVATPKYIKDHWRKIVEDGAIDSNWNAVTFRNYVYKWWEEFQQKAPEEWALSKGYSTEHKFVAAFDWTGCSSVSAKCVNLYNNMLEYLKIEDKYNPAMLGEKYREVFIIPSTNQWSMDRIGFVDKWPKEFNKYLDIDYVQAFNKYCLEPIEPFLRVLKWSKPNISKQIESDISEL